MLTKPVFLHAIKTGKGQQVSTIPWLSSDFSDLGTTPILPPKSLNLAQPWFDDFGNIFLAKKASSAFVVGNVASWPAAATSTVTGAGTTTQKVVWAAGGLTANAEIGNFLAELVILATGITDGLKLIKANTATVIVVSLTDTKVSNLQPDADAYITAPANGDAVSIIRPYNAVIFPAANAAIDNAIGIALGTITSGDIAMFQVGGLALVSGKGNVTAWAANAPVVPDGTTAGLAKGAAAAAANAIGLATQAFAGATGLGAVFLTIGDSAI